MQSSASRARASPLDSPDSPATAGEPGATTSWDVALEDVKRSLVGEQRTLLGASRKYCPPDDRRRCCGAPLLLSTLLVAWTVWSRCSPPPSASSRGRRGPPRRAPASLAALELASAAAKPPPSPYKGLSASTRTRRRRTASSGVGGTRRRPPSSSRCGRRRNSAHACEICAARCAILAALLSPHHRVHSPQVSARALGADFVVSALAARGDGVSTLLHMPLTATQYNVYRLALAPDGASVDLVVPQLLLRATENSTISEATHAYGAWSGWVRTFKARRLKQWALNESATEAAAVRRRG